MDHIRFYNCPPTSKKREPLKSEGSTSINRPVFDVLGPGSNHVQYEQAASRGRFQKLTASSVAAIELPLDEESGVLTPASGSAGNDLFHANSLLDPSRLQFPGLRSDPDAESMETTQLPLYRNAAVGNFIEQQNNHRSDLGPDKQSVDPFSEVQDDNYSTHISVANAHTQLGHPGSWQMPSLNNDQGLPSPEINAALILGPKLLDEEPDCTNHGKAGARDQTAESTSDGGRSVITKIPRNAMDVQPQPNSMPPISHDAISRSQSTDTSLPTAINSQAMSPQPSSSLEPIAGHDLSIYPLQRMDSFLLTAVASGLQELQQLSASPDAWISLKSLSSFDGFTILGIRPLRDDRWLLLAKVLCPTYTNPRRDSSAEDVVDCHTENRRKRRLVGNRVSLVNTYEHGRRVESTNGRVSRLKRGNWKETEDQELSSMMEMGMPWSSIFAKFPRRSEAAVRSRWYCVLKQLAP